MKGQVYIVGAGPGDPKLVTLKGAECIGKADVLIYDRLVSPKLLKFAKPDCELIYAGKSPDRHTLRQEEINQLMIDKAKEGKIVTRLKGGDPFVFGRGGEEVEALRAEGIPFEVVPGITSAIAAPAYAGIPVTHRDFTSLFCVITGHEDPEKNESAIHWRHVAQINGTLIFLMGMENLALISGKLLEHGMSPATPVAIIQWGTRSEQRVLKGTLSDIATSAREQGFGSPAIIIVGEVVNLRDKLQWFENKPLFGKRIIVTRARHQASELSAAIEELGGEPLEFPAIDIAEPSDCTLLTKALTNLKRFEWLVFTSTNGVDRFFRILRKQGKDIRDLAGMEIVAIGPATKARLEDKGLNVTFVPDEYRAEKIIEGLASRILPGQSVLLARAEEARDILPEALKALGADVWDVPVYKTIVGTADKGQLKQLLAEKQVHAVTFTSSSTVRNFLQLIDHELDLLEGVKLFSIGPITSATAREHELTIHREAKEYTIKGLVEALAEGINRP